MNPFRKNFPFFKKKFTSVYLDSAATSLKPSSVIKAIVNYYKNFSINSHSESSNVLYGKVWKTINETRMLISKRINCDRDEVVFFPSATYAFNILALSLEIFVEKNDGIILTKLEHSSNCFPGQSLALKKLAFVDFLILDKEFVVDIDLLINKISKKTKIVSFSHINNSLGTINDVERISKKIKEINPHCLVIVDACQSIAHSAIDVKKGGIDALIFSAHKSFGPTGLGVLGINNSLARKLPEILGGGGKNIGPLSEEKKNLPLRQKFEVGTLPLAQLFGFRESLNFFFSIDLEEIELMEKKLVDYAINELKKIERITIYNENSSKKMSIVMFNLIGFHAHDVVDYLGRNGICARAGNFCCPYLKEVILTESSIRISFSIYNNFEDIDFLLFNLKKLENDPELLISL